MVKKDNQGVDENRRRFLTVMLIGSGAFIVEKIVSPLFSRFLNNSTNTRASSKDETNFQGFKITENKNGLSIHDNNGTEILQIDQES